MFCDSFLEKFVVSAFFFFLLGAGGESGLLSAVCESWDFGGRVRCVSIQELLVRVCLVYICEEESSTKFKTLFCYNLGIFFQL